MNSAAEIQNAFCLALHQQARKHPGSGNLYASFNYVGTRALIRQSKRTNVLLPQKIKTDENLAILHSAAAIAAHTGCQGISASEQDAEMYP